MKDKENLNNYRTLNTGEIVQVGDLVGQIVGWEWVWYPVGPATIGQPCPASHWIKREIVEETPRTDAVDSRHLISTTNL